MESSEGVSQNLPHSASTEGKTHSVIVSSVPLLNIAGQLGLPPLFLNEKQGEEHQKWNNAKNETFNKYIISLDIFNLHIPIASPVL